jgi:hypothetical protein
MHAVKEWKMSEPFNWGQKPRPTSNDPEVLAEEIEDYVLGMGNVTLVELERWLGPQYCGTGMLVDTRDPNLVFWKGYSEAVIEAFNQLIREGRIEIKTARLLIYAMDGGALLLPIAKRPPREGYRRPHWLPVLLNVPRVSRACR